MTPADQATPKADAAFSIRRRQRRDRRVIQVSSSVSAMDALRARIRAQSKKVAVHIQADPAAQAFISDWTTPEPQNH
jgi:hypothetical protein